MNVHVRITVKGLVQGVGYRYFCYKKSLMYSITGYARNLTDGSVEVDATGEKNLVNDFIKELKIGPTGAKVNSIYIDELKPDDTYKEFKIM